MGTSNSDENYVGLTSDDCHEMMRNAIREKRESENIKKAQMEKFMMKGRFERLGDEARDWFVEQNHNDPVFRNLCESSETDSLKLTEHQKDLLKMPAGHKPSNYEDDDFKHKSFNRLKAEAERRVGNVTYTLKKTGQNGEGHYTQNYGKQRRRLGKLSDDIPRRQF